jgi:hypothetical protein
VIMPIALVTLDIPIWFPGSVILYPSEMIDFDRLNVVPSESRGHSFSRGSSRGARWAST